jgi:ADP-ribose pyrophosphatase YjhB (NUDIX family)
MVCYNGTDMNSIEKTIKDFIGGIENVEVREKVVMQLRCNAHLVTGALLERDGKFCLMQELQKRAYMQWNEPLGHWDMGEGFQDCARREVKEETGYDVELTGLLPLKNVYDKGVFRVTYVGKVIGGSPNERDMDETNAVEWFTPEEIKEKLDRGEVRGYAVYQDVLEFLEGNILPLSTIIDISSSDKPEGVL